jgi:RNA polymerase sigma factor (sigma-70 family)
MWLCEYPTCHCVERRRKCLAGDPLSRDELVRKFTPLVRRIVQKVLDIDLREEWEDTCQDVLFHIVDVRVLGQWDEMCLFCKWLPRVAANKSIDLKRHIIRVRSKFRPLPPGEVEDPRSHPHGDGTRDLERREWRECIERSIEQLPEELRLIYDLAVVECVKREEVARTVRLSLRTVQSRLRDIRERLRHCEEA